MSRRTGQPGPWPQPTSYGRNDAGQYSTIFFEDVDPDKINALAASFDLGGMNYQVDHSFGKSKLTVQIAYNAQAVETPIDLWEYSGESAQKDLLSAAVPSGITATLSQKNAELIRLCLGKDFSQTASKTTLAQTDFTDGNPANAFTLYKLMLLGYTDAYVAVPRIRHTQTVSYVYPITLAKLNVGRIITTSSLIALENPPTWAVTGLPNDLPPGFTLGTVNFGWFKFAPTIQQIAFRKMQIIQEFQYGLWPVATFGSFI